MTTAITPQITRRRILETLKAAKLLDDTSPGFILSSLLNDLVTLVNSQIPNVFTTVPVNLFGSANNHLDPLLFNGAISAGASDTFCLPQECTNLGPFGGEVCIPPDWIACATGQANASLDSMTGLSGLQLGNPLASAPVVSGNTASATGSMTFTANLPLALNGEGNASGGVSGFSVPLDLSVSATLVGVTLQTTWSCSFNLSPPELTNLTINTAKLQFQGWNINIGGLGPFGSLLQPLFVDVLVGILNAVGGPNLSNTLTSVVQNLINSQMPLQLAS